MSVTRTCSKCQETMALDLFPARKLESLSFKRQIRNRCKACNAEDAREFRKRNPGYRTTKRVSSIPREDRILMSAIRFRLKDARSRCTKLRKPAPTINDQHLYTLMLVQDRKCALTGASLSLEKDHPLCLSLDQIDPGKGYEEGNVQWVAWCVNRAKGDLSLEQFYELCEAVLEYRNVQRPSKGIGLAA